MIIDSRRGSRGRRREGDEKDGDTGPAPRVRAWLELRSARFEADGKTISYRPPAPGRYIETIRAWRALRANAAKRIAPSGAPGAPPSPAPATDWIPLGPAAIRSGGSPMSGRTSDIAVAPGGTRIYAATANGGVWRSDDGGASWRPLMEALAAAPTHVDSDSLACGAIAINPSNPDRIYVGTGEGESAIYFNGVFGVVYSYAGIGPLRNDNGGDGTWIVEPVSSGSPSLNGQAFYALAVDPTDAERVLGATTAGIYRREPDGTGNHQWTLKQTGRCTSVVVAQSGGTTVWYAAMNDGPVLTSSDGGTWTTLGTGFPAGAGRVSLAVQPTNTNTIYAFSAAGVHRLDVSDGTWRLVSSGVVGDGYRCAITVDPSNTGTIYLGNVNTTRGTVTSAGSGSGLTYSMATASIGGVHADLHRLVSTTLALSGPRVTAASSRTAVHPARGPSRRRTSAWRP